MTNKLGSYISNLMTTIVDKEERFFVRKLAFSELTKLTHEIDYDYLSGTDHLSCVLEQDKEDEENQLKFNFGDKNENK